MIRMLNVKHAQMHRCVCSQAPKVYLDPVTVEKDLQLPLNQILILNFYVDGAVGYNACRHIVWDHYVLGEEEEKKKKVYMKMRAGLQPQCSHFTWQGWKLEEAEGKGTGIMKQRLALSVQLLLGWPGRDTGAPQPDRGLSPSTLT